MFASTEIRAFSARFFLSAGSEFPRTSALSFFFEKKKRGKRREEKVEWRWDCGKPIVIPQIKREKRG